MSSAVKIERMRANDLPHIAHLQPEGWSEITPYFSYYLQSDFCIAITASLNDKIVGIGACILFNGTAWLAHIIVSVDVRNQGVGSLLTQWLILLLKSKNCDTIFLLATALGEPVYKKFGFVTESNYLYFKGDLTLSRQEVGPQPFEGVYEEQLYKLDRTVTGEDRRRVLQPNLHSARIAVQHNQLAGYFLPDLGDGLIIATNDQAGTMLMSYRAMSHTKAALPEENQTGIAFLVQHGFKEYAKGVRMRLGKWVKWEPSKIYNRIGGNMG